MAPFEGVLESEQVERATGATLDGVPISATLKPGSPKQLAACLARAQEKGVAVVISGQGTQLARGNLPATDALFRLQTSALREPLEIRAAEGVASLGAGLKVSEVEAASRAQGMTTRLALADPGSSVGGTIAVDPLTPERAASRRLRDDLLGLEVALVDGTLTHCGGAVVKNVSGFDLVRLYCGSHGTLGAITSANLRLRPLPAASCTLSREFDSMRAAFDAVAGLERVPAAALITPSTSGARLIWRLEGVREEVDIGRARLTGDELDDATWRREREPAIRPLQAGAGEAMIWLQAQASQTPVMVEQCASASGDAGWQVALPLCGAVRACVSVESLEALYAHCASERWLITIDSVSNAAKARFDVFGNEPESLPLMRALKNRFDSESVLAPGRFLGGL